MEVSKKIVSPSVAELFTSMEYGPAPESDKIAQQWLEEHQRSFGHFINNQWEQPTDRKYIDSHSPADGKLLAKTIQGTNQDVETAVSAAKKAQQKWAALTCHARARHLYNIARHVQKVSNPE